MLAEGCIIAFTSDMAIAKLYLICDNLNLVYIDTAQHTPHRGKRIVSAHNIVLMILSWQSHKDRVMQYNLFYFCGIYTMSYDVIESVAKHSSMLQPSITENVAEQSARLQPSITEIVIEHSSRLQPLINLHGSVYIQLCPTALLQSFIQHVYERGLPTHEYNKISNK